MIFLGQGINKPVQWQMKISQEKDLKKKLQKNQIGNNLENKKWLQLEGIKQKNIEH